MTREIYRGVAFVINDTSDPSRSLRDEVHRMIDELRNKGVEFTTGVDDRDNFSVEHLGIEKLDDAQKAALAKALQEDIERRNYDSLVEEAKEDEAVEVEDMTPEEVELFMEIDDDDSVAESEVR